MAKNRKKDVQKKKLEQSKSLFKLRGVIVNIDSDKAYKTGEGKENTKNEGKTSRSLGFSVRTSKHNQIRVGMFDYEPEFVYLYNSELKKEDKNYKGTKVEYEEWLENMEEYREDGYAIIQPKVGYEYDEDGKLISHGYPSYYASKLIYDNFSDGDSVVIEGDIRYSTYENQQKKTVEQKTYTIRKMYRIKDVDLEDENYEEITYFEQQMIYVGMDIKKKEKKAYVTGRIISYNESFHDTQFVLDFSGDGEDGNDADMVQLIASISKKFKFGDRFNAYGNILNKAIVREVPEEEKRKKADASLLGGRKKPQHAVRTDGYISEMQIEGIDAWDKGVYKEEDFLTKEAVVKEDKKDKKDKKNKLKDELGGKSKNPFKKDDDPFADDEDEDDNANDEKDVKSKDDPFADDDEDGEDNDSKDTDEDDDDLPF